MLLNEYSHSRESGHGKTDRGPDLNRVDALYPAPKLSDHKARDQAAEVGLPRDVRDEEGNRRIEVNIRQHNIIQPASLLVPDIRFPDR